MRKRTQTASILPKILVIRCYGTDKIEWGKIEQKILKNEFSPNVPRSIAGLRPEVSENCPHEYELKNCAPQKDAANHPA